MTEGVLKVWVSHMAELGTICLFVEEEEEEVEEEEEGAGIATVEMEDGETGEGEMEVEGVMEGDILQCLPCPTPPASCRHFDDE